MSESKMDDPGGPSSEADVIKVTSTPYRLNGVPVFDSRNWPGPIFRAFLLVCSILTQ